jgi:hypothetical protein
LNKGIVGQAQEQGAAELAAKAPQMAVQEQMASQQKEQQAAEMAQAENQAKEDTVMQALGEHALAQDDREHQAEVEADLLSHQAMLNAANSLSPEQ